MIKAVLLTLIFLAQPEVPYELLGSNKYYDRAIAVAYLSKKFSVDDFKLFEIVEKSKDLEASNNANNVLKNRFYVNNYEGYPSIYFMSFKYAPIYEPEWTASLKSWVPLEALILSYIKSKTDENYLTLTQHKMLTQAFVIDLRFKYKMSVEDINKWLMAAWVYENDYNNRLEIHQRMMEELWKCFRPH